MKLTSLARSISVLGFVAMSPTTFAAPVDLSTWAAEGNGVWVRAANNNSVTQTQNNDPTVFFSSGNAQGNQLSGTIRINSNNDDDYIGFVLGYTAGDLTRATTNFMLIDWKKGDQSFFGCTAKSGLSISRVTAGLADSAGAWCHNAQGVTELQRASTLGSTGWDELTSYSFGLNFSATRIEVTVNGATELALNGTFANGSFGFYNYSQADVTYGAIQQVVLPPPTTNPPSTVPVPATLALLGLGFFGMRVLKLKKT